MGENPGKTELKRIIKCMKDYEYDDSLEQSEEFDGYYKFNLIKRLHEDHTIKVTIDFPTAIDKHTYTKDDNGNFLYEDINNSSRAHQFIKNLIPHNSTKKGGQKKKQRKTRKK